MKTLLIQVDGKIPNIALMRIAQHHRERGDQCRLMYPRQAANADLEYAPDLVYASAIFEKSRPLVEQLRAVHPDMIVGGTGVDVSSSLEKIGITTETLDYSIYPHFTKSLGFTQRGCRLRCSFCVVPRKEGVVKSVASVNEIWRGDPYPRELLLLDNDFFGQEHWRSIIEDIRVGGFKVSFNQGINARFLTDETAEAIASIDYRDDSIKVKRIYTAWDNLKDEERLMSGLESLKRAGVNPDHIMVYMLIGYWPGETHRDRDHRRQRLREFGARPYPMPFTRDGDLGKQLVGFQRWVIGAYDKRVTWEDWQHSGYEPRRLRDHSLAQLF